MDDTSTTTTPNTSSALLGKDCKLESIFEQCRFTQLGYLLGRWIFYSMWDWEKVSKKSQTAIKLVTHIPKSVEKATCKRAKAQKTFQARTDQKHLYQ